MDDMERLEKEKDRLLHEDELGDQDDVDLDANPDKGIEFT